VINNLHQLKKHVLMLGLDMHLFHGSLKILQLGKGFIMEVHHYVQVGHHKGHILH